MSMDVKLPDLGDGVESGEILEVLVREGDQIAKDQSLFEVETDKATVEVPAPRAGRVTKIHVQAGQTVRPGQQLLSLEFEATAGSAPSSKAPEQPKSSLSVAPATASPAPPRPPAAAPRHSTPPAPTAGTAPAAKVSKTPTGKTPTGTAPKDKEPVLPKKSAVLSAKGPSLEELEDASEFDTPPPRHKTTESTTTVRPVGQPIPAGPAIRRFAREVGVDLSQVHGSGTGGRITREDVLQVVRMINRTAKENGSTESDAHLPGQPGFDDFGPIRVDTASKIRRTIAARMSESSATVARVTNFDDADVTELDKVRKSSKQDYASTGIKLTTMPFLMKAVAMALRRHPLLNAVYDAEEGKIIYKRYVNIGMAVDSDRGLVVPVLRHADQMSIAELARQIASTAERVRANKFTLDDVRGGTFTISNLGAIGGTYSTPIVNVPEVAILLTGRTRQMPVVLDEQIAIRLMMPLSLSYDHRLVDGATAARFLNDVIDYLEAPARLLLSP